jgi:hypothetical protein
MTNALVNFKKICSLPLVRLVSLEASLEAEKKKGLFRLNHWRFSRKAKCLTVVAIVAVLLLSAFEFFPKQNVDRDNVVPQNGDNSTATPSPTAAANEDNGSSSNLTQWISELTGSKEQTSGSSWVGSPGLIQSAQTINSTVWMEVAANAWAYFQLGVGVNPITGLPYAGGLTFEAFTDWDLGVYIQAVIDAQELNLTGTGGAWGSSARIDKVLTFLENRPLNNATNYPWQFYDATTGKEAYSVSQEATVDITDTGRLFVALSNLINFNSSLAPQIITIVGRCNYTALVPGIESDSLTSVNIYSYYVYSGFASFWPNQLSNAPINILNNILSAGNVTTYGNVSLPKGQISCVPLLCSVFELDNNNSQLMGLMNQVYLAHEAYYNATRQYVAFGEGNGFSTSAYLDEWVVLPNGDTWKITASGSSSYLGINQSNYIIYNYVAFGFLSLYNTMFARNTVIYLEQRLPDPSGGYAEGADNSGNVVSMVGSNTNGLILDAALYYIQNNP